MNGKLIGIGAGAGAVVFLLGQVVWALVKPIPYQEDLLTLPPRGPAKPRPAVAEPAHAEPAHADPGAVADPTPAAVAADDEAITFISVEGAVERKQGKGPWTAVLGKERLEVGDLLRTGADGKAELQFGANSVLKLRPDSQLTVRAQAIESSHFVLQKGQAELTSLTREKVVRVSGPKGMEVQASNARLEAFVSGAVFGAVNNAGEIELRSGKSALDVPTGMAGWAVAGKPPLPPRVYTGDPELEVATPDTTEVRSPALVVTGAAHPLARVAVNDGPVKLRADGSFAYRVPLDEGENHIDVTASLLGGEIKSFALPTITRLAKTTRPAAKPRTAGTKPKATKKPVPKKGATMKWGAGP